MLGLHWDIHCHVVDNLGDVGVCWRLAADLASRGDRVRLWIDDASALRFMAPRGAPGVTVLPWGATDGGDAADVVVEAFGCELPPAFVASMQQRASAGAAPVWINLEYLSAEAYVERSHGLPSPQPGGLIKWFYFPGFTDRTGGLIREPNLEQRQADFDAAAWLAARGCEQRAGERTVSLFSYDNAALPELLKALSQQPTLLLLTPGRAQEQVAALSTQRDFGRLRLHPLPWLCQTDFDHLLWSCDLNLVRGEDSLVRAIWAAVPFVWQAYPQRDGAHRAKVEALIDRLDLPLSLAEIWRAWNGMSAATTGRGDSWQPLSLSAEWIGPAASAGLMLRQRADLGSRLREFAARKRDSAGLTPG